MAKLDKSNAGYPISFHLKKIAVVCPFSGFQSPGISDEITKIANGTRITFEVEE